jgi:uncharacterized lipoprotein YehR (DUF1307 family)
VATVALDFYPRKPMNKTSSIAFSTLLAAVGVLSLAACTQERQNQIKRDIQNWTGTDGVLEVYGGDKVVKRFLKIDKLSTALGTDDGKARAYRFGYGVLDENLNGVADASEKRVYFEVSDFTQYVFYESPR